MQKLINFLRGEARISVTGPFPERFLNLCGSWGLGFWEVEQKDSCTIEVSIAAYGLKKARQLAKRGLCQLTVVGRRGLPTVLLGFRQRYGLMIGLVMAVASACVLSRFIWVVEVTGNQTVSEQVILSELERIGFGIGSYGPAVDERALSNQALLDLDELSFLSVNITGVRAQVIVREAVPPPEVVDERALADVVAAQDGVILDINTLSGQTVAEEGQAVLQGEVLISHLLTYESGDGTGTILSTDQTRAEGEVWAMTRRIDSAVSPLQVEKKRYTGAAQTRYALCIGKRRVNFLQNSSISFDNYDKIKTVYTLPLFAAWEKTVYTAYETEAGSVDRDSAEAYLRSVLDRRLRDAVGAGQVLSTDWTVSEDDGVLTVTVRAACCEQIGETVEITGGS